jgi:transcriptional regulator with XRE-family HTH domain
MAGKDGLGERIKEARLKAGLTQVRLADHLGVTDPVVAMWEHGKRRPTIENLLEIARITFTDPAVLLSGTPAETRFTASVSRKDELMLLRFYRQMRPRARENMLQFLGVAAEVSREIDLECDPA